MRTNEQGASKFGFAEQREFLGRVRGDPPGLIRIAPEAGIGARHIVGYDGVASLAHELLLRIVDGVAGFGSESDDDAIATIVREPSENVIGLLELNGFELFDALLELSVGWLSGPIVRHGRSADEHGGTGERCLRGFKHLGCRFHENDIDACWRGLGGGSENKRDVRSQGTSFTSEGNAR